LCFIYHVKFWPCFLSGSALWNYCCPSVCFIVTPSSIHDFHLIAQDSSLCSCSYVPYLVIRKEKRWKEVLLLSYWELRDLMPCVLNCICLVWSCGIKWWNTSHSCLSYKVFIHFFKINVSLGPFTTGLNGLVFLKNKFHCFHWRSYQYIMLSCQKLIPPNKSFILKIRVGPEVIYGARTQQWHTQRQSRLGNVVFYWANNFDFISEAKEKKLLLGENQ
jgi:hypothetical protein